MNFQASFDKIVFSILPILFLINLIITGIIFNKEQIDIRGDKPIAAPMYFIGKYLVIFIWVLVILKAWGVYKVEIIKNSLLLDVSAYLLWCIGFFVLYVGKFSLGRSFRIGFPKESTELKIDGLYRYSRHPMYLGLYCTIFASILYTENVIVVLAGMLTISIHHKIVLSEERILFEKYGNAYIKYMNEVRRYI